MSRPANQDSFFLDPTTEEVQSKIKTLKTNKFSGPSSIPRKALKLLKTSLSKPSSLIANLSFETNTFPETVKHTDVTAIFKKDDNTLSNNYWPIPLLLNISKIIERLVNKTSSKFLNLNDITARKVSKYGVISGPYFPAFRLNTERDEVSLCI